MGEHVIQTVRTRSSPGSHMFDRPAYLLTLAPGMERARFSEYLAGLPALYARHGGQHLAVAPAPTVERFGHHQAAQSVMLSRWSGMRQVLEFWRSPDHQLLARRRSVNDGTCVAAFEGEATTDGAPRTEALAMFLGPSPTPALLEAEGARAVALARERQVEALEGPWACGDIAIYAWDSARNARRQLVTYSSGQRGRAMLIPTLPATRSPAPIPSYLSPFISAVA